MTEIIVEALGAALMLGGVMWAIARWTAKVDRNTEATDRLTASFESHTQKVTGTLTDHEVQLRDHEHRIGYLERGK